jgi:hypothetical protein
LPALGLIDFSLLIAWENGRFSGKPMPEEMLKVKFQPEMLIDYTQYFA